VLQDEALLLNDNELPPDNLEANVETFFLTSVPLQIGQVTPSMTDALRTNSSKFCPQDVQLNSKSGILPSSR